METNEIEVGLDQAVTFLRGGVQRTGMEPALQITETWEQRLAASGSPELVAVADNLAELRVLLLVGDFDPAAVGRLLVTLGEQVREVADSNVGAPVADRLSPLSELLTREGDALVGR